MASQKVRTFSRRYALAALLLVGLNINVPVVKADPIVTAVDCQKVTDFLALVEFDPNTPMGEIYQSVANVVGLTAAQVKLCEDIRLGLVPIPW